MKKSKIFLSIILIVVAAFALGACGVQMGTRFLVAKECTVSDAYKKKVLAAM